MHLNRACHLLLHYYNWISNREDTEKTIGVVVLLLSSTLPNLSIHGQSNVPTITSSS